MVDLHSTPIWKGTESMERHVSSSLQGEFTDFLPIGHDLSMGAHRMIVFASSRVPQLGGCLFDQPVNPEES